MDWKDYRRTGVQYTRGMGRVSYELQNMQNMVEPTIFMSTHWVSFVGRLFPQLMNFS
jgi:hypothetical protein